MKSPHVHPEIMKKKKKTEPCRGGGPFTRPRRSAEKEGKSFKIHFCPSFSHGGGTLFVDRYRKGEKKEKKGQASFVPHFLQITVRKKVRGHGGGAKKGGGGKGPTKSSYFYPRS